MLFIVVQCEALFYLGVKLFIGMHKAIGFMAIGKFFLGIILIFMGVLLLCAMGYIVEPVFETNEDNKKE